MTTDRFPWSDECSGGLQEIDEQHKRWIDIHNRLHDELLTGSVDSLKEMATSTLREMHPPRVSCPLPPLPRV